jgi:DNA-binding transcriptional regulator YhcF (GntR family)
MGFTRDDEAQAAAAEDALERAVYEMIEAGFTEAGIYGSVKATLEDVPST